MDSALDLLRRMPPNQIDKNLKFIAAVQPDVIEDVLAEVDQPLKVKTCPKTSEKYLLCDYNRDGDSYRSPQSNEYDPPCEGVKPSAELRKMEVQANDVFAAYREAYYEGGISSVYLWDNEDEAGDFGGAILIKKEVDEANFKSSWDSIHIVEVEGAKSKKPTYRMTSTLSLSFEDSSTQHVDLSGSFSKQTEEALEVPAGGSHLINIGNLVQKVENSMRSSVEEIYFGKTSQVTSQTRSKSSLKEANKQSELAAAMKKRLEGGK